MPKPIHFENEGRILSEKHLILIKDHLKRLDFYFEKNNTDVNEIWSGIDVEIKHILDAITPLKPIEIAPWDDEELSEKRKARDYYFFKQKNSDSQNEHSIFKKLKSEYQSLNRQKMIDYYESKGIKDFKNNKLYWEFYSFSIKIKSCKDEDVFPSTFTYQGKEHTGPEEIGNLFNTFFTTMSSKSLSSDEEGDDYIDKTFSYLKSNNRIRLKTGNFKFSHTTERIVEKLIQNLDASSGAGHSGIPTKVIKYCCNEFVPLLTFFFNHCIDNNKFPDEWKCAIVTPLFKNKGDNDDVNNYRGISVLPPIAKIFEKILAAQITIYLKMNNILFNGQHGFRSGHSCETALHELISDLNLNRDKRLISLLLFIDFRKAFDTVDARKLLRKLLHYGFDNSALDLITNYFISRFQSVRVKGKRTPLMSIRLGVPQGSVLGPLFFLIMINDLAFILEINCKMFADDTTIYDADIDLETLIRKFVIKIKPLFEWCHLNKLDLNLEKTYFMFVTNRRLKLPSEIIVNKQTIKGVEHISKVEVVNSFKLLGVTIDTKLNFTEHCSNLKKIINRKMFSIKRLFYLATKVKIHFFKTFILPYFDYCLSLIIYFPTPAIQSLSNCFNFCLLRLFNFRPAEINYLESSPEEEEKIMNEFLSKLQSYSLFTFQSRVFSKLLIFSHGIINNPNSPTSLKKEMVTTIDCSGMKATQPTSSYGLRSGLKAKNDLSKTKFSTLTFGYFFPRLLSAFKHLDFSLSKISFQDNLGANLNPDLKIFLNTFTRFDVKYSTRCTKRKRNCKKKVNNKIVKIIKNTKSGNIKRLQRKNKS